MLLFCSKVCWDRDVFFRKDFLGSLNFSFEDLKRLSAQVCKASGIYNETFKMNKLQDMKFGENKEILFILFS